MSEARFDVKSNAETHFSWLRTRMSTERTLISNVRTATALIGFGFTIFQFFESQHPARLEVPRVFGLPLVAAGTISPAIAGH